MEKGHEKSVLSIGPTLITYYSSLILPISLLIENPN